MTAGTVHGFCFTVTRYSSGYIAREHPAYRRPDGAVMWAPDRAPWRDAPDTVAASFVPAGDAARAAMAAHRDHAARLTADTAGLEAGAS